MILDERLLTVVLFKINNKLFDLCEHETKNHDLNDYLLIRSLFTKITSNDDYERLCSYSLTRIKTIFIIYFIMSDDRSIIDLSSRLIIAFNLFRNKYDGFEFKKNSSLEFESKSF